MFFFFYFSSFRDPAREHGGLHGLVLRGRVARGGLRPVHPLVAALHAVLVRLLVQTDLRSVQVKHGEIKKKTHVIASYLSFTCWLLFLFLQERQLVQVLRLLLRVHLSVRHLRHAVHRHHWLGR